jgi:co-chaperonin GroES (HSP10)
MTKLSDKFQPSRDWIIINSLRQEKTDAGIFIPETAQRDPKDNIVQEVLAAGPEAGCKPGDIIYLHPETQWYPLEIDGKEYGLINQYGFIGVLTKTV